MSGQVHLAVAFDNMSERQMLSLADELKGHVNFFKVGDALDRYGIRIVKRLREFGEVFADPKINETPPSTANRVAHYVRAGAIFVTVHTETEALKAALAATHGSQKPRTRVVAVTELTSTNDREDLVQRLVRRKVEEAVNAGVRCVTCAAADLPGIRHHERLQVRTFHCVVPGIRPSYAPDPKGQKRIATPADAIRLSQGRDITLVVGSPVVEALNWGMTPLEMVRRIRSDVNAFRT